MFNAEKATETLHSQQETVEKVTERAAIAKLNEADLKPITQALYFSDHTEDYKLLELNDEILGELKAGNTVSFRGETYEKAVLCTSTKTFEVKGALTSNSLLLFSSLHLPYQLPDEGEKAVNRAEVLEVFHSYYEVKVCEPRLEKLKRLLDESSYRGSELESELFESGACAYTMHQLLCKVQASQEEVMRGLKELEAFTIDGKWRILENSYYFRVCTLFMNLLDDQSWPKDGVPRNEAQCALKELMPEAILQHLFHIFTENYDKLEEPMLILNGDRVCRFYAECLLKATENITVTAFLKYWQQSIPESLNLTGNLGQLKGIMFVDNTTKPFMIKYLSELDLPEDEAERMKYLFSLKEKWTLDEIHPYIKRYATASSILLKYARPCTFEGVRFYTAKHGK